MRASGEDIGSWMRVLRQVYSRGALGLIRKQHSLRGDCGIRFWVCFGLAVGCLGMALSRRGNRSGFRVSTVISESTSLYAIFHAKHCLLEYMCPAKIPHSYYYGGGIVK